MISSVDLANSSEADNYLYSRIIGENGEWQYNAYPHGIGEYATRKEVM